MTHYKKLAELISDNKDKLLHKLEGLTLPSNADEIKRLCIDYVEYLTRKDSEYMNQLSLLEQDLLSPVLKVMETLYGSDIELSKKVSSLLAKEVTPRVSSPVRKSNQTLTKKYGKKYGPALAGVAGGTLLATMCKPSSCGVILLGSVVSVIIGKILYCLFVDKIDSTITEFGGTKMKYPEYPISSTDANSIIKGLEIAGDCIDKVLLTYRKHLDILNDDFKKKEETYNLEKKYIGVLESFQTLLGNLSDMSNTPVVNDSIKNITQILSKQGFEAVDYSEETKGLFNVKEDDVTAVEQFSPAIIKKDMYKDTLILKGDVVIPNAK